MEPSEPLSRTPDGFRRAREHRAEALALLAEATAAFPTDEPMAPLAEELREGRLPEALLWVGGKDEAVALVLPERAGTLGWHVEAVVLRPEYARAPVAHTVVQALAARAGQEGRELLTVRLFGPLEARDGVDLSALGLFVVRRTDWVFPEARAPPTARPLGPEISLVPLESVSPAAFARLQARAYSTNAVDRLLFLEREDPMEDATRLAGLLLSGQWAPWLREASFAALSGGRLVAAVACNDHHGPLISDVATDPEFRGQGLAAGLLSRSVAALRERGHRSVRLVVTEGNDPALSVYRRLGFEPDPRLSGEVWCSAAARRRLERQAAPPP